MADLLDNIQRLTPAELAAAGKAQGSDFGQGLRSGMTAAKGQLQGLAGGVADAVGADQFAARRYADAHQNAELAAQQAPEINDFHQIDGLRSGMRYLAGQAGSMVPMVGAGIAGAAAAPAALPAAALVGATAATAPFLAGDALNRMQADPEALKHGAGERLALAGAEGVGKGVLMNAVPQFMGGKLLGRGAEQAATRSLGKSALLNASEGVAGNAVASGGGEAVSQATDNYLNPNRDTSGDMGKIKDAAITGGIIGAPFGAAGFAGDALHGKTRAATDAVKGAVTGARDAVTGAVTGARDAAAPVADKIGELAKGAADSVSGAASKLYGDAAAAMPEHVETMAKTADFLKKSTVERATQARDYAADLLKDVDLPPEVKDRIAAAAGTVQDQASQAYIATTKFAVDQLKKTKERYDATDFADLFDKGREQAKAITRSAVTRLFSAKDAPIDLNDAKAVATGRDTLGPEMQDASPEAAAVMAQQHDDGITDKVNRWAKELVSDRTLSESSRAELSALGTNFSDRATQIKVAGMKVAAEQGKKASAAVDSLHDWVMKRTEPKTADRSEFNPGVAKVIKEEVVPFLREHNPSLLENPDALNKLADSLRSIMAGGKIDETAVDHLQRVFGGAASRILTALHDKLTPDDIGTLHQINKIAEVEDIQGKHAKFLEANMKPEVMDAHDMTHADLMQLSKRLSANADESAYANVGAEKRVAAQRKLKDELTYLFGDKAATVEDAFAKEAKAKTKASKMEEQGTMSDEENAHDATAHGELEAADPKSGVSEVDAAAQYETPRYYGGGKDKASPELVLDPSAHNQSYPAQADKGPAHKLLETANAQNRDRNVSFVKADALGTDHPAVQAKQAELDAKLEKDRGAHDAKYEKDVATRTDALHRDLVEQADKGVNKGKALTEKRSADLRTEAEGMARGMQPKPEFKAGPEHDINNYGLVAAEGMKQEGRLTTGELDSMRAKSTSEMNSKSRIDTGTEGVTLDAMKVTRAMYSKMGESMGDDLGGMHRTARAFMEGIAAAQDHLGREFKIADDVVVARKNGKEVTYGDIKALKFRPADPAWMKGLSDEEINKTLSRKETLAGFSTNELGRTNEALTNAMDDRVAKYVDFLKEQKIKFTADTVKEFINSEVNTDLRASQKLANAEKYKRSQQDRSEENKNRAGIYQTDPNTNVIDAASGLGEKGIQRKVGMDGQSLQTATAENKNTPEATYARVNAKLDKMAQASPAAKALAARARALDAITDKMTKPDVLRLHGDLLTATKPSDIAETVNRMTEKYARALAAGAEAKPEGEPSVWGGTGVKKPEALDEAAVAGGSKAEARQYSAQMASGGTMGVNDRTPVHKYLTDVLGPKVKLIWESMLHAGDYRRAKADDLIRVSVHALDPMGTAFHESLHAFMQHMREADLHGVNQVLFKAADSAVVRAQLERLLAREPAALAQIRGSAEERAAYMYQFMALTDGAGKPLLKLGGGAISVLGRIRDAIYKTLGIWTNDARATHILEHFNSGEYAKIMNDRDAVSRVMLEQGTNKTFSTIRDALAPIGRIAENIAGSGDAVLRGSGLPSLTKLADLMISHTTGTKRDPGFIPAQGTKYRATMNALMERLPPSAKGEHLREALESLQSNTAAASPEGRIIARDVKAMLREMHGYMTDAGVKVDDLGADYFPVVWDASYIASNKDAFRKMAEKYERSGKISSAEDLMHKLVAQNGNEFGVETIMPGMQHIKQRQLDFITPADRAPFLQKDLMGTMASYVMQATRRAEWARRFGEDGAGLRDLLANAERDGASKHQMEGAQKYIRGIDGTLGDDIDPGLRRMFGNMTVYQNIRLLPMAVFSMAVDPGGIMVRGGTMKDAFTAFKRGIMEIPRGFKKDAPKDEWYKLAETMGVIENTALIHSLGSSYSQGMVGDTGRRINDAFFKYNLVEQMNTSMRVSAMPAALGFLASHADGKASFHSKRWLAELGLTPGEVIVKNGRPLLHAHEFEAAGYDPHEAADRSAQMTAAVNKWVDGAILRPNAAHKPTWMNDPHFALISHLKQFVYSFNETIIKRVVNEAKHGNYTPAYALASYVPTMMAADFIKGAIVTGGGQPAFKDNWDAADYVGNGMQRAGLFGVGQFAVDAYKDTKFGGTGLGALSGPMLEQLADGVKTLGGRESAGHFLLDSLPANVLLKGLAGGTAKADPVFAE